MTQHPLQMAPITKSPHTVSYQRNDAEAQFNKMWEQNPEQFNPQRNCMQRDRLERTWNLIEEYFKPFPNYAADLGCGSGIFSERLANAGMSVDAVDISKIALDYVTNKQIERINPIHDYVPYTSLKDSAYPLVVCTEIIAYMQANQFRLLFSEVARIVQIQGFAVCSTPVDIDSIDATQRFLALAETEFKIHKIVYSYHRLYIKVKDFLEIPSHYTKAHSDPEYRRKMLEKSSGIKQKWLVLNSNSFFATLWKFPEKILSPFVRMMNQSERFLLFAERICRFIWGNSGISHVIFIGSRRPILENIPKSEQPIYRRQKRQVWE